jgi:DNA polymerase I-like protein with 3'-5' exonuclease and polymerase domains
MFDNISEKLDELDARIVHTQHDEMIIETREDIANQVQAIVKESMEEALEQIIPEVPFVAEIRVAEAWG